MNATGWVIAGFLVGWILGTWMSWRKILKERRQAAKMRGLSLKIFAKLDERSAGKALEEIRTDREKLDSIIVDKDTKH